MWRIKRRRTKPIENKAKTGVIYPKLNATAKPNRYQSRNTYLDVKCNKKLGAGCTNVGCQCQDLPPYPPPNITSFSDITNVSLTGVADYKTRVNTIAPASFHDFTTWYGPDTNLGTTYQGVYGNSAPPSGNANFSLPLPTLYNHISITYNNPHPGSGSDAVYIFIGGVGSGALPTENPLASQAVNEIKNGTTGASKTYSQRYQAGDYLKIQEKASVITTALVIELTYVPNIYCCKTAPYRNPILGYRKHLVDACQRASASGIFVSGSSSLFGPPAIPSNNTLMYSTDGINWVGLGNTVFGSRVDSVKWNGKIWVAVGGHKDTNSVAYSYDGFNWVGVGDPFSLSTNNGFGIDVASNGSDWIAISNNNIIASTNGIDWNPTNLPASFSPFGIAYGQDKWLLFGEDLNPSPKKNIWYSTDNGNSWSSVSMDGLLSIYADRGFYNGSLWVAVGTGTNKIIYSADGVNWNAGNNVGITGVAQDVFYNGFIWIAGGESGQPLVWSDDGINWNPANNQPLSIVNGVTWNSSINLWVATNGSSVSQYDFAYSEDGKTWTGVPKDTNLMNTGSGDRLGSGNINLTGFGYTKDVSGNVYKDNYAKTCATHPEACYNQVIRTKQNKNGCVDESYNYTTNQYLNRRCLKFKQQEFNFQSQVPVDASGSCTKFKSCNNCQYKTNGDCDCSANGFCIGINKLPCEVKNTKCYAIYKRSNPKFKKQGAVSGGSRINRLKYQTRMKAQGRTVNGRKNVINGRRPATLYRTSKPLTLRDNTCVNPPPPPSDLSYETLSGSIIVTWRAGDISKLCRIAPLTGFTIQRTGSPFGHTEPVFGNTYTYSNLPIGSYDIRVRSDSYYGSSDWAYLYNIIVSTIPSQVLNLTGTAGDEQVSLSWTAPIDTGGSPITEYKYNIDGAPFILTGSTATILDVSGLTNGTSYTFKVLAVNSFGDGAESSPISLTTFDVPDAPTGLNGTAGLQQVTLSWTAPIDTGGSQITGYKYNIDGGAYISTGAATTSHTISGLTNGTSYTFKVLAVNAVGDGAESSPLSIEPGYSKLRINGLTTVSNNFFYQSGNDNATPSNTQSDSYVYCYIWIDPSNTTAAEGRANSGSVRIGQWAVGWNAGKPTVIANYIGNFTQYGDTGNYLSCNWQIADTNPSGDYIEIYLVNGSKFKGNEVVHVWNDDNTNNNPEYGYNGRGTDAPLPGPSGIFTPWSGFLTFIL